MCQSSEPEKTLSFTSGHLLREEGDHLGEVDGAGGLPQHAVHLGVSSWSAYTEKRANVVVALYSLI